MRILIVDDEARFAAIIAKALRSHGYQGVQTSESAEEALQRLAVEPFDAVVTDLRLPRMSGIDLLGECRRRYASMAVILMTAFAEVETAREALKRGALDYLVKPFEHRELFVLLEQARSRLSVPPRREVDRVGGLIGASVALRRVFEDIRAAALSDASVLILGESGTGKEAAARAIHELSDRHRGPFVEAPFAALSEPMLESELFGVETESGAERGSPGFFERAAGGTLFLDEVGEVPLRVQPKLLHALQERRFTRVGGTTRVNVDVRIVSATNRVLAEDVGRGRFREDLFYRLEVLSITMPPLRDRPEDIAVLANHFLEQRRARVAIAPDAIEALKAHDWPGNVRELSNVIERAALAAKDGMIEVEHIVQRLGSRTRSGTGVLGRAELPMHLEEQQRRLIEDALARAAGNKTLAASFLGITRRRLYSRMRSLGIDETPE